MDTSENVLDAPLKLSNGDQFEHGEQRFAVTIEPDEDGTTPYDADLPALLSDERKAAWENKQWHYVFVLVTAVDQDGNDIEIDGFDTSRAYARVESDADIEAIVRPLCDEIIQDVEVAGYSPESSKPGM